MNVPDLAS